MLLYNLEEYYGEKTPLCYTPTHTDLSQLAVNSEKRREIARQHGRLNRAKQAYTGNWVK